MSISELFTLKKNLFQEQLRIIRRYYPTSPRFALIDLALGFATLFFNPYRICRKRNLGPYGETPLTTLHRIATFCELTPSDCWMELGSGRGKGCFWISQHIGCRAIGIEAIPLFSHLARILATLFRTPTTFQCADLFTADLTAATCLYLYSTCMDDEALETLAQKVPPNAKVVTISAPIATLPLLASFPVTFPWGETTAFIHRKTS